MTCNKTWRTASRILPTIAVLALAVASTSTESIAYAQTGQPPLPGDSLKPFVSTGDSLNMRYGGGPLIGNVQIVSVFWGPNVNPTVTSQIGGFYSAFSIASQIGWLCEYDSPTRLIAGGSFQGNFTINPTVATGTNISDANIGDELAAQINAGALPTPNTNTLYVVHFPSGDVITDPFGDVSCVQFCAYHYFATRTISGSSRTFPYAVLPDLTDSGCSGGCGDRSVFDNTTKTASHEISEAITDPDPFSGWSSATGGEIGDPCNFSTIGDASYYNFTSGGVTYAAQVEWSRSRSLCAAGSACPPHLALTPYGRNNGYTLAQYIAGLPNASATGPVGITFATAAQAGAGGPVAWVADEGNATLYEFPDGTSPLIFSSSLNAVPYGAPGVAGLATVLLPDGLGPHFYLAEPSPGQLLEFSPTNGAPSRVASDPIAGASALVPYPHASPSPCATTGTAQHCNHLFVSGSGSGGSIYEVDLTKPPPSNTRLFANVANVQGLTWNPSGTTLYAVSQTNGSGTGTIVRLDAQGNTVSANPIGQFGAGLDGIAAGAGTVDGCLYVSDAAGTVWEIKLAGTTNCSFNVPTGVQINPIANGGSRGSLAAVDPNVTSGGSLPSLLVTQTDSVYRIGPPVGGGFFGAPTSSETPVVLPTTNAVPAMGRWPLAAATLLLLVIGVSVTKNRRALAGA